MQPTHVVLRQIRDADGSRLLEASMTVKGDVLIEGRLSTNLVHWLTGAPHTAVAEDLEKSLTLQSTVPVKDAPKQFMDATVAFP